MENNDADEKLVPFLRNLATSIEKRQLLPRQLQSIGEFFMTYQFQEQAIKDNDNSVSQQEEFSQEELLKFLVLGWHIYSCILRKRPITVPSSEDEEEL